MSLSKTVQFWRKSTEDIAKIKEWRFSTQNMTKIAINILDKTKLYKTH